MELEDLSFQFLQEITDGFSEERVLGEGTFGVVYKVRFVHALLLSTNMFSTSLASTPRRAWKQYIVLLKSIQQAYSTFISVPGKTIRQQTKQHLNHHFLLI